MTWSLQNWHIGYFIFSVKPPNRVNFLVNEKNLDFAGTRAFRHLQRMRDEVCNSMKTSLEKAIKALESYLPYAAGFVSPFSDTKPTNDFVSEWYGTIWRNTTRHPWFPRKEPAWVCLWKVYCWFWNRLLVVQHGWTPLLSFVRLRISSFRWNYDVLSVQLFIMQSSLFSPVRLRGIHFILWFSLI